MASVAVVILCLQPWDCARGQQDQKEERWALPPYFHVSPARAVLSLPIHKALCSPSTPGHRPVLSEEGLFSGDGSAEAQSTVAQ